MLNWINLNRSDSIVDILDKIYQKCALSTIMGGIIIL